jgi:hypothetical protein
MTRSLAPNPVRDTDSVQALVSVRRYLFVFSVFLLWCGKIVRPSQRNAGSTLGRLSRPEHRGPVNPRSERGCSLFPVGDG